MNIYTVGKVTQGLCDMLLDKGSDGMSGGASGVAIAYDPRRGSVDFAEECARILAANGVHAYLFDDIRPTPLLSFTVRHLGCAAGIMITASHNPSNYNGYKAYGADGAQMSVSESDLLARYVARVDDYSMIRKISIESAYKTGLLTVIGADADNAYLDKVHSLSLRLDALKNGAAAEDEDESALSRFKLVYTPLHGTGNHLVRRVLRENGYKNLIVVPEQEFPDPEFSTVKSPNPEYREAFDLAISLAEKEKVDIIIGSDPDCDRVGVVFRNHGGEYVVLTGNQIGCLLMEYILAARKEAGTLDTNRAFVVKSIVTTKLANLIAARYGVKIYEVYTGFKYICKTVNDYDEFGDGEFIYGFEESNGYLAGNFVRDKDGVIASMLIAEMAAWYYAEGKTLADALVDIYGTYGYTEDDVVSYTLEGIEGLARISEAMDALRSERPSAFGKFNVAKCSDYLTGEIIETGKGVTGGTDMPETSNVLAYLMTDGSVFQIRPSGTEPKIKIYYGVTDVASDGAKRLLGEFKGCVSSVIEKLLGIIS
jgi:phosphoglucomutase